MKIRYALFFILTFIIFIYLTFPTDSVRTRIEHEISANTNFDVDITSFDITPALNFDLKKVVVSSGGNPLFMIDSLLIDISLFDLMGSEIDIDYSSKLLGGGASGSLLFDKSSNNIKSTAFKLKEIDLSKLSPILPSLFRKLENPPNLSGRLTGSAEVEIGQKLTGDFDFASEQLTISELRIQNVNLPGGSLKIPDLGEIKIRIKGNFENDRTNLEEISMRSSQTDLMLTGFMPQPGGRFKQGRMDLKLELQTSDPKISFFKLFLNPRPNGGSGARIVGTWERPIVVKERKKTKRDTKGTKNVRSRKYNKKFNKRYDKKEGGEDD